ncbi:MAG: ferrochelatase [Gammaproteobacteria bacterium]|nr:MAG: ferrochelatase [Gammaproteobacteria bacterium]
MSTKEKKRIGVLVANLGSPDEPTAEATRAYLAQFLWDPRVVAIPRLIWWPILHWQVLPNRPKKTAEAYAKVWMDEGAPLVVYSQRIADAMQGTLCSRLQEEVVVVPGMTYGQPSIASALHHLREENVERIIVLPLYPQFSYTSTACVSDAVEHALADWEDSPEIITIEHYFDNADYIGALASSIRQYWQSGTRAEKLLLSFHGLPVRNISKGDPYLDQCMHTAKQLFARLGLDDGQAQVCFQSRFGKAEWLQPYTDETLQELGASGINSVDVVCPGFAADCLETLEEMAMHNRDLFLKAGGKEYHYIPCLNDTPEHVDMLAGLVLAEL